MRQTYCCCQGYCITRKKAQLHSWLTLSNTITHCWNTTSHLRCCTIHARCRFNLSWKCLEGLMRRKHIIVGRNNPNVRCPCGEKGRFIVSHRGIGVGLISATQVGTPGSIFCSLINFFKIISASWL